MRTSERINRAMRRTGEATKFVVTHPRAAVRILASPEGERERAHEFARSWPLDNAETMPVPPEPNRLREYFEANQTGPGIWKFRHYFDVYQRHLARFVGRQVSVVEIGIYSGGSLPMWRSYFGEQSHVHGVDIEPACRAYEGDGSSIHIGDQADRAFWAQFRRDVPDVDIVIEDGGHRTNQQVVTLEELLPQMRPGGVYICEDVTFVNNKFTQYAAGLVDQLNEWGDDTCALPCVPPFRPRPRRPVVTKEHQRVLDRDDRLGRTMSAGASQPRRG